MVLSLSLIIASVIRNFCFRSTLTVSILHIAELSRTVRAAAAPSRSNFLFLTSGAQLDRQRGSFRSIHFNTEPGGNGRGDIDHARALDFSRTNGRSIGQERREHFRPLGIVSMSA